jgi:4-hydroxy-2-oxoglutarate aldolase
VSDRQLAGIFPPIPTPFDAATGDVAVPQLQQNIRRLLAEHVQGIVVSGTTGEASMLDPDEQREVVAAASEVIQEQAWLIVGTGAESTRQTIALSKAAATEGADAVLVRAPSYFSAQTTPATLAEHFRAVADASSIPVIIYNIPKYTRIALDPALLQQLAGHEQIIGVKDSSGDLKSLGAYRAAVPEWSVLAGSASLLYAGLELGCQGGVVGVSCYAPALCLQLMREFSKGDRTAAGRLQEQITPLDKEIVGKYGPAGVKAAMDAVGLYGGPTRPPLAPLSAADRERVSALVRGD